MTESRTDPMRADTIHAIQDDARAHAATLLPPEPGSFVAWAETGYNGVTVGISELHRVGDPIGRDAYTTCRHEVPDPVLLLPLSPAMIRTMPRCGFCEAGVARSIGDAA